MSLNNLGLLYRKLYPLANGTRYPLGFGPLFLWETSSGNKQIWGLRYNHWNHLTPYILLNKGGIKIVLDTACQPLNQTNQPLEFPAVTGIPLVKKYVIPL